VAGLMVDCFFTWMSLYFLAQFEYEMIRDVSLNVSPLQR